MNTTVSGFEVHLFCHLKKKIKLEKRTLEIFSDILYLNVFPTIKLLKKYKFLTGKNL